MAAPVPNRAAAKFTRAVSGSAAGTTGWPVCHLDMGPPSQKPSLVFGSTGVSSSLTWISKLHKGTFVHGQLPNHCCSQGAGAGDLPLHRLLVSLQGWFSPRAGRGSLFYISGLAFDVFFLANFEVPWLICALRFTWLFFLCVSVSKLSHFMSPVTLE